MMDFRQQGQTQGFPGFPGGGFPGGGFPGGGFPGGGFPGFPGGGGNVDRRLDQLERQIQRIDRRLDQLDRRVDRIERRLGYGYGSGRPEYDYGTNY